MKYKYANLIELAEAFKCGELNKDHYKLILDNDSSSLNYVGPLPDGIVPDTDLADRFYGEKNDVANKLFSGNGYSDLEDACKAAGIPCEWC